MNLRKVAVVFSIPFVVNLILSCCNCLETSHIEYANCGLSLAVLDNSGRAPVVSTSNEIDKDAFGIRVRVSRKEGICLRKINPVLMASAFATSCECPPELLFHPIDSIVSVKVITIHDFDTKHRANADISDLFNILSWSEFQSIDEYVGSLSNELYRREELELSFHLLLMFPPENIGAHQFEVQISLSDGRVLKELSETVKLL